MIDEIAIILPTYNGENFVGEQIDSIIGQTYTNWNLYVRDDGSTDNTVKIIKDYEKKDSRIHLMETGKNLGVKKGIFHMLEHIQASYYMTCDQDDFWLPNKVENTYNLMKEKENEKNIPLLVHTDLKVVDENLNVIHPSMFAFQKLSKKVDSFFQLAIQNNITGCTVMINEKLKNILVYDSHMLMHDHWMGLVAAAFGKIYFLDEATILYRQHGNNSVGAKEMNLTNVVSSIDQQASKEQIILDSFIQIYYFKEKYVKQFSGILSNNINIFLTIPNENIPNKIKLIRQLSLKKSSGIRTLYYYFVLLFKIKKINY